MASQTQPRSAASTRNASPPVHYQFIDGSADPATNLTQVRRHVMREFLRQKRPQQQQQQQCGQGQTAGVLSTKDKRPSRTVTGGSQTSFRIQPRKSAVPKKKSTFIGADDGTTGGRKVTEEHKRQQLERKFIPSGVSDTQYYREFSIPPSLYTPEETTTSITSELPFRSFNGPRAQPCETYRDAGHDNDGYQTAVASQAGGIPCDDQAVLMLANQPVCTVLSASRRDPFDTLPMHLNDEDTALFDFYANAMPTFTYQSRIQHPRAHNWYAKVFIPEAMKGPITFQATILVHASSCQGWMRGIPETERSLVQRTRSIEMLRRHLTQNPNDNSDATITAILSTAAADDFDPRLESKRTSWMHLRAAMQKIRNRGGPAAFQSNRRLAMLINWQDYIIVGYEGEGPSTFHYEHRRSGSSGGNSSNGSVYSSGSSSSCSDPSSSPPPLPEDGLTQASRPASESQPEPAYQLPPCMNSMKSNGVIELQEQTEVFLNFLRSIESLSLTHKDTPTAYLPPARYMTFSQDALLYKILKSPLGIRYASSGMRKQIISRMAALLMLNAALWDYRHVPSRIECLLRGLQIKIRETSIGCIDCIEAVIQVLLEANDTFDLDDDFIAAADKRWPPPAMLMSMMTSRVGRQQDVSGDSTTYPAGGAVNSTILHDEEWRENYHRLQQSKIYEPETPAYLRPWFVGRMLKVVKRLGRESWWRVNDYLFTLLSMECEGPTLDASGWADELRQEILSAPLTSYIMPSMV